MKRIFTSLVLFSLLFSGTSQTQIDNPGFENWEDVGLPVDEPVDWSSIKTSDVSTLNGLAPVVWDKSTDAHTGSYSLELINVSTFGVVANGTATNGRVHADFNPELGYVFTDQGDTQWNQSFTDSPDSLVGWYKYTPAGSDKGKAEAILHTGNAQIPENGTAGNWVGRAKFEFTSATGSWTRFSTAFNYYSATAPEYILFVLTSGDSTIAVNGSTLWIDDLALIYNPTEITEQKKEQIIWFANNTIFTGSEFNNSNLNIYDISGKLVNTLFFNGRNNITLDLPTGLYIAEILTDYTRNSIKVYIQ